MSDPKRWLDPDSDAPEGARELLSHARPSRAIDKRALAISAAALAKLAATPAAAAALPIAAKLALTACAAVAVGVVAVRAVAPTRPATTSMHAHTAAPTRVQARHERPKLPSGVEPVAPAPEALVPVAEPSLEAASTSNAPRPEAVPHEAAPPRRTAHSQKNSAPTAEPPPAPAPDALAAEVAQLDAARVLLPSDPERALALALQHAAREPQGVLAPERELIAIDALRRLGRRAEAQARANALLARYPGSIYRQRLTRMLP